MEFERKQKNKKGRKKKKKRDVARIFRVLSLFKALCVVILCYTWFYIIVAFLTITGALNRFFLYRCEDTLLGNVVHVLG